jgi:hypothetical protein
MAKDAFIQCRVSAELKDQFRALAEEVNSSESMLLKNLVEAWIQSAPTSGTEIASAPVPTRNCRLAIRLHPIDRRQISDRAAALQLAPATLVAELVHAHLASVGPPSEEPLDTLKRGTPELRTVRRALQALLSRPERVEGDLRMRDLLASFLGIAERLRDGTKALLTSQREYWKSGVSE